MFVILTKSFLHILFCVFKSCRFQKSTSMRAHNMWDTFKRMLRGIGMDPCGTP